MNQNQQVSSSPFDAMDERVLKKANYVPKKYQMQDYCSFPDNKQAHHE